MKRLFDILAPLSDKIAEKTGLFERLENAGLNLHAKMTMLNGATRGQATAKRFVADALSATIVSLVLAVALFAVSGGDLGLLAVSVPTAGLVPVVMYKRLDRKIEQRRRSIVLELPEFLNKVTLLVNAGETVQNAIVRCAASSADKPNSPLAAELSVLSHQLRHNAPFHQAMEQFSRRCGVQEVSFFTTTVLMNYRRGGDVFVIALKSLCRDMWERRKAMTKTLGEEASSKLIFPMLFIFLTVMTIVAAPAVMMLK